MLSRLKNYLEEARILIVDDEPANVRLLEANLEEDGQLNFQSTTDPLRALPMFLDFEPDLILLDLMMPKLDGFGVMRLIQERLSPEQYVPIIVLTADASAETKQRALAAGARDFLTKPFNATELHLRMRNLLELRFLHLSLLRQNGELNERVQDRTAALREANLELRESQRQAVQRERLHAFSEMAGGVVHDFNNSLAIILGYTELLLNTKRLDDRAATLQSLRTIQLAAQDGAQVVNRLRHFYRPRHEDDCFSPVALQALVSEAAQLGAPRWEQAKADGRALEVKLELEPIPDVLCNASEMREVMLNLMFNAVDAMAAGGRLTLRVRATATHGVIEVADTGAGMPEEVRARCLEPFFSTKGAGGTGLGLAMVQGIVRRHEGLLEIESAPGAGTTFRLSLPFAGAAVLEQMAEEAPVWQRPLRVLVAEDDAMLRTIIPEQLKADGHTVEVAVDGREALIKMATGEYDLLLTDLSMPVMNGADLAVAARQEAPQMRIIMLTGFGTMIATDGATPPNVDLLLSKPVSGRALSAAIGRVMEPPPRSGAPLYRANFSASARSGASFAATDR